MSKRSWNSWTMQAGEVEEKRQWEREGNNVEEQSEGWTKQCLMKQNAKNMIKFSINDAKTSDVILQYKKIWP